MESWFVTLNPVCLVKHPDLRIGYRILLLMEPGRFKLLLGFLQVGSVISLLLFQTSLNYGMKPIPFRLQLLPHYRFQGLFDQVSIANLWEEFSLSFINLSG